MLKLQHNVPVPPTIRPSARGKRRKYPFEAMQVGDMFFLPGKTRSQISGHLYNVNKQLGIKLQARLAYMRERKGKWEPAEHDDPDASLGVGVWRVE